MNFTPLFTTVKKRGITILLTGFLVLMIVSPDAKAWLLQRLASVGLFNASIKKEGIENMPENIAFSYTNPAGITASTTGLKGKVVLINFWASWCPPCRAEMPSLEALYKKLKDDRRIVFLFMNEDEDKTKAIEYLNKNNYIMPLYNRSGNVVNEIFGGTLPTTIILNKEGKVVFRHEGVADYNSSKFIKQLEELL